MKYRLKKPVTHVFAIEYTGSNKSEVGKFLNNNEWLSERIRGLHCGRFKIDELKCNRSTKLTNNKCDDDNQTDLIITLTNNEGRQLYWDRAWPGNWIVIDPRMNACVPVRLQYDGEVRLDCIVPLQ